MDNDTLHNIKKSISESSSDFAVWECRQKPYEHPKTYNPVSGETTWCSGACVVVLRDVFRAVGGFDKKIFMYAEDVDLSWKIRVEGYKLRYIPNASLTHFCYKNAGETKPLQYYCSIINNLNLRLKYGSIKDVLRWCKYFINIMRSKLDKSLSKSTLIVYLLKNIPKIPHFAFWRFYNKKLKKLKSFKPTFLLFDYEQPRLGAFIRNDELITGNPLVSIIVRTCGRPAVLKEALTSINNQTYKNIETIVIEDGKNTSEKMIKTCFPEMNIKYEATNKKVGRCRAANIAMKKASGVYFNFLDDDDLFFHDHVETLLRCFQKNKGYAAVYSASLEAKTETFSERPEYKYNFTGFISVYNAPFERARLFVSNLFPIQSVMFKKEIYEKYGGFDVDLDNLEDWEFWARIGLREDFTSIEKTTSLFKTPSEPETYIARGKKLESYYEIARHKIVNCKKLS